MKQLYLTLLIVVGCFTSSQLYAQNCPLTGSTDGNALYFFYTAGTSTCDDRPSKITVGASEFILSECDDIYSVYNLNSGSPLISKSPFTADLGFGTCEFTGGKLPEQALTSTQLKSVLRLTNLYPNPVYTGNEIQLKSAGSLSGAISIYSVTGKLVTTKSLVNFSDKIIDISRLSNGVYIVKIESASVSVTKKLIISK